MISNLSNITGRAGLIISKHSPEILLGVGLVGFIGSLVAASKASVKAEEIVKKHDNDMKTLKRVLDQYKGEKYTEEDYAKDQRIVNARMVKDMIKAYESGYGTAKKVLKLIPLNKAYLYKSSGIGISLMYAYIIFDENITIYNILGCTMIIAGIMILSYNRRQVK